MTDADHAAKFAQVSRNLGKLAEQLCADHPEFPRGDFARVQRGSAAARALRSCSSVRRIISFRRGAAIA